MVSEAARRLLAAELTVWLDCSDEELVARLGESERPLLGTEPAAALARLREEREDWYREVASVTVDTSGEMGDALARLRAALETSA